MLAIPIILFGPAPLGAVLIDLFGFASGVAGLVLFLFRLRFLSLSRSTQMAAAGVTWLVHVGAFVIVLYYHI
jgi:hypothetical protein